MQLGQNIGKELNQKVLLPFFISLLSDPETEIRVNAASKVAVYAGILELEDIIGKLIPAVKTVSTDAEPTVRGKISW